jgi:NADH-quinone oxidoreductase subunit E
MSLKKIHDQQPDSFEFSNENKETAKKILKKYPEDRKKKCSHAISIFSSKAK